MINFGRTQLEKLIIHKVGNPLQEEPVILSDELTDTAAQPELDRILTSYFLSPFREPVFYHFHHVSSLDLNEVYTVASAIFEDEEVFVDRSKDLANILYGYSNHPRIKGGEMYVAYFGDCIFNEESVDA